jgi:hypothetical protein
LGGSSQKSRGPYTKDGIPFGSREPKGVRSKKEKILNPKRIDFGAPAAERDIKRGLADYFFESDAFHRVKSGTKTVVLGNRGAGKSAIFQVLAQRQRAAGFHIIELAPEDYSYEFLGRTMVAEGKGSWSKYGAYAVAWKYLIYVLVMAEVAKKGPRLKKGGRSQIYRYIRDNHPGATTSRLDALISYLKRIEAIKIGPYEASIKTREKTQELEKLYRLAEIGPLLPALRDVLEKDKFVVLVDELDRGWDASEDAQAFVAGLFQACMSINTLSPNLRVYISLRQELYDSIPALYEDAQKFRDVIEVISWDEESLLKLIAKRIRHSLPEHEQKDDHSLWSTVFSQTFTGKGHKSFDYLVSRTLYRPREIIQFCAQAIEEARDQKVSLPIGFQILSEAERLYSEERTKDIVAEYRFQYPGLASLFEVFRGRNATMDYDQLSFLCLEMLTGGVPTKGTQVWLPDQDPDSLIETLWQVGFLQAEAVGSTTTKGKPDSYYLGPYQIGNLNLRTLRRFKIHPMFWSYLGIRGDNGS